MDLETEILRKDETIRKLTAELAASQTFRAIHRVGDMTLKQLIKRRAEALERHRMEYVNRVGYQIDLSGKEDDDEID